jgi:hypothetical protein
MIGFEQLAKSRGLGVYQAGKLDQLRSGRHEAVLR